ncbi:MAG: electron transfer flavoprotein subunit beta/FixA family protein [Actinomycetota bacterium]|nr:electron transfer flavoprotein subunit beta/FixA family protein [Actinomycetota bacterium]MDA3013168.1 electron transfer flavoprotein subunit beta/FixA family protein [Actinomycetota bacterium]
MKIAVCAKQIPDPAIEISYEKGHIKRPEEQVLDDTDRYGIELALQLKEKFDAEVTILSMGPKGTLKGVQQALQMGADKAMIVSDENLSGANSLTTSNVLSELAKLSEADLIILGTESTDGYSGTVPQQISRYLNLDCISYVKAVEVNSEKVILTRQTIEGSEKVDMPDKCVISVTAGGVEPRYPNFKDIMAAKSKSIQEIPLNNLNLTAKNNLKFIDIEEVESSKNGQKVIDDGEAHKFIIEKLKELKIL